MKRKTVLITGASRGIGKAIARRFMQPEYYLVLTCKNQYDNLIELQMEAEEKGAKCVALKCDVADYAELTALFENIASHSNGVDILINNAGISYVDLITDTTPEQWQQLLATNLSAPFYCSKLALPHMIHEKAGKIVNISSVWGIYGASMEVAYSATKGGLNAMTKALAKEVAPSNIQVNAIACGAIDTEMNQFLSEEDRVALEEEIPAGRMGKPEEVANLVYNLCTGNDYLTGQVIQLDGGWI